MLLYIALALFVNVSPLTFSIKGKQQSCFYDELEAGEELTGNFQVVSGGNRRIHFRITDPNGSVVTEFNNSKENRFSFNAPVGGVYKECVTNPTNSISKKVSVVADVVKKDDFDKQSLQGSMDSLQETLSSITREQNYIKQKEQIARNASQQTQSKVILWSVIQILVVLSATAGQFFFFTRIFRKK
ncbi:MAG: putative emp24/gp25L/p24 family protein [Streblomastix strix]|uniref:Putative emp24/gp25L/p24 family protein n=1 Tax=Streblomastix strix TaxID=222440 RepID=A0A5J4XCU5_9EUKA|nr:MAG: putative emp24/gp25L/p24 family protein [Streblomastix strix]